jgi:lambda repressor-like predicted transcriptional regulator
VDKASPPTVTSDAILHAISSPYPRARYVVANVVGVPAFLLAFWCWILPDRIRDRLVLAMS